MTPRLAFCTTCMNRGEHLEGTFSNNAHRIQGLPVQWIILDYSSTEPVSNFLLAERERKPEVFQNIRAFRAGGFKHWSASHAKNIAHVLPLGSDFVCNLDVDTFLVDGLTEYLLETMMLQPGRFIAPPETGVYGSICMHKWHFFHLGGYDEDFKSYGFEDTDLIERSRRMGLSHEVLPGKFEVRIAHSKKTENGSITDYDKAMGASWDILSRNRHSASYSVNAGRAWGFAKDLVALW